MKNPVNKQRVFILRCWQEREDRPTQWRFTVVDPLQEIPDLGFGDFNDVVDYLTESLADDVSKLECNS